jgi:hypothetical protein
VNLFEPNEGHSEVTPVTPVVLLDLTEDRAHLLPETTTLIAAILHDLTEDRAHLLTKLITEGLHLLLEFFGESLHRSIHRSSVSVRRRHRLHR